MKTILIAIIIPFGYCFAQQIPVLNNNIINPTLLNPSLTGAEGSEVFLHYRKQWLGFEEAPESALLTTSWKLNEKSGIGIKFSNDQNNILANTSGKIAYAQSFKIKKQHLLSFGASFGINQNRILFNKVKVKDYSDELLLLDRETATNLDADLGVTYSFNKLRAQFIVPQLLGNKYIYKDNYKEKEFVYNSIRHFIIAVNYEFLISKNVKLEPYIQARSVQGLKFNYDFLIKTSFKDQIWLMTNYSIDNSFTIGLGVILQDKYILGYSSEFSTNRMQQYNKGSHEIVFGLKIGAESNNFVNDKNLKKLEENLERQIEKSNYADDENEALKKKVDKQEEELEIYKKELESLKKENNVNKDDLLKFITENQIQLKKNDSSTSEQNESVNQAEIGLSTVEDKLGVDVEAKKSYYTIVSAFKSIESAKKMQKILFLEYSMSTKLIKSTSGSWYFCYTKDFESQDVALKEILKIKKMDSKKIIMSPWIYYAKR